MSVCEKTFIAERLVVCKNLYEEINICNTKKRTIISNSDIIAAVVSFPMIHKYI